MEYYWEPSSIFYLAEFLRIIFATVLYSSSVLYSVIYFRHSTPPARLTYDYATDEGEAMVMMANDSEPITVEEALSGPDKELWKNAMKAEMASLHKNETWILCKIPSGRNDLKCRWVFRIKPAYKNQPKRFKARLVAKGFTQKYGVDYQETFAPVVKLTSVRTLLALAVQDGAYVHQMDVRSAFFKWRIAGSDLHGAAS